MRVTNPIMEIDMPDIDIIRVNDMYYMVSTTMFVTPGAPVLRSGDLVHWEITSYIFNVIEDNPGYRLEEGKNAYGQGQWATSLKYYEGKFYACFACNDLQKTYIYSTDDIEKTGWERITLDGIYHDMSFVFEDGHVYLVYGNGEIRIVELESDLSGIKRGGVQRLLFSTPKEGIGLRCEGCRWIAKDNFHYFFFIDWPTVGRKRRRVICYRSAQLLGDYECKVLVDDDMGFFNNGIAQGTLIDTKEGEWYAMLFQDHGAVGRIPYLMPVTWEENWPVLAPGGKIPRSFETFFEEYKADPLIISDSFSYEKDCLKPQWEWNHNPVPGGWSLTKRTGYLRLFSKVPAANLMEARGTLTQKTESPYSSFTIEIDASGMKPQEFAGLTAFQGTYGSVGIRAQENGAFAVEVVKGKLGQGETVENSVPIKSDQCFLRIDFNYYELKDRAAFYWSYDGEKWEMIGTQLQMKYTLDLFIGYRIGIFCYGNKTGGFADFRNFIFQNKISGKGALSDSASGVK